MKHNYLRLRVLAVFLAAVIPGLSLYASESADYVPGEVIVKLKGRSKTKESQAFIGKAISEKSMNLKGSWSGLNMHHFSLKGGVSVEQAVADLKNDPDVLYVEPNYIFHQQSIGMVGQAVSMSMVQAQSSSNSSFAATSASIGVEEAWSAESADGSTPIVAVIDTGVDMNHTVFVDSEAIWTNPNEVENGIDDDGNGYIDDLHGWNFVDNNNSPLDDDNHGTHVAGIVLGTTQDITASPIAKAKIKIMPLKFLDANGSGTTSDAIKAIYYAVNNGAKVLNNSWGGGGFSQSLLDAVAYAYSNQVAFVAAAGNSASNNDVSPIYPANYDVPNMMSIAATSDSDLLASFSNYGAQTVHVGSPGVSIWSTLPNDTFGRFSGTSMAAPFVSGIAALMLRESPNMNGYQIKNLLFSAAEQVSGLSSKTTTKSRINVYNALMSAKTSSVDSNQPAYTASSSGDRSIASLQADGPAGCGLVAKALYDSTNGGGPFGPNKNVSFFALLLVLVAPVILSAVLRGRQDGRDLRTNTRYHIDSQVKINFGDRQIVGQVSSISLGGVQLNTDAWLDNGGIVKMSIQSPDGKDEIAVEGKVVWSEEKKRYGVAFANANDNALASISRWTQGLLKS